MGEYVSFLDRLTSKWVSGRFASAAFANLVAQGITVIVQIASVPLFLSQWSLEQYGAWLVLSAVPTYFALADVGFVAVTINKMTIVAATGDVVRTNVLFQTAVKLSLIASLVAMALVAVFLSVSNLAPIHSVQNKLALGCLAASAVLTMSSGLLDAVFRSQGEFSLGTHLLSGARLVEWAGMASGLMLGGTFLSAAIGQLSGRAVGLFAGWALASRRHRGIRWGIAAASQAEMRELAKPALAFMAFPVANALSIQGMVLLVGHLFGGAFLAIFSTYRTVSRVLVQAVAIVSRSLWPEISKRFGRGDKGGVMRLYVKGTFWSIGLSFGLCVGLAVAGEWIIKTWTSGKIPFDGAVFALFLLATTLTSAWQMGLVTLSAINRHGSLSATYLVASALPLICAAALHNVTGALSPAIGLVIAEVVLAFACYQHVRSFARRWVVES